MKTDKQAVHMGSHLSRLSARKIAAVFTVTVLFNMSAMPVAAAELTIFNPSKSGHRIDICLNWGMECAGEAAHAYCKAQGFDRASAWEPDPDVGAESPTIVIGTDQICAAAHCDSYAWISCVREDAWTKSTGNGGLFVQVEWEPVSASLEGALVIAVRVDNPEVAVAAVLGKDRSCFLHTPPGNYILFIEDFKNSTSVQNTLGKGMPAEVQENGLYLKWTIGQWSKE